VHSPSLGLEPGQPIAGCTFRHQHRRVAKTEVKREIKTRSAAATAGKLPSETLVRETQVEGYVV
jgi:hypothetical protein